MATLSDIGLSAAINILSCLAFFLAFAFLRLQPFNDRVYFPKWYLKGARSGPGRSGTFVTRFVNLDFRSYLKFLDWMPAALKMPEPELIDHAGLDSAIFLRIYLIGLKIFAPITFLAFAVLVPVNWTNDTLAKSKSVHSDIDKLSISNIPKGSQRSSGLLYGYGSGQATWILESLSQVSTRLAYGGVDLASFSRNGGRIGCILSCVEDDKQ